MTADGRDPIVQEQKMLHAMATCAYEFGAAFAAEARATEDPRERIAAYERFERCFLAMRMGVRLRLRLAQQRPGAAAPAEREVELEREAAERSDAERAECEVEREREYEPVSLPAFLNTLGVIRSDAAQLGERLPAQLRTQTLPALDGLLARATAPTPQPVAARARLAAGVATAPLVLDRPSGAKPSTSRFRPGPRPLKRPP